MTQRSVHEGILMLRTLTADDAFVWGLINVSSKDATTTKLNATQPFLSRQPLATTVTHHSLRAAKMHLQQLAPPDEASMKDLDRYTAAVGDVFAGVPPGSVPDTMVADTAEILTSRYAGAYRSIRGALLEKGAQCCALLAVLERALCYVEGYVLLKHHECWCKNTRKRVCVCSHHPSHARVCDPCTETVMTCIL